MDKDMGARLRRKGREEASSFTVPVGKSFRRHLMKPLTGVVLIRAICCAALLTFLTACASHSPSPPYIRPDRTYYLSTATIIIPRLPPPPLPGTTVDGQELQILKRWQEKRTPAKCAQARAEARGDYRELFADNSPFPPDSPAAVSEFFRRGLNDLDYAVGAIKDRYQRPRPFLRDVGLTPCINMIGGYSYLRGHAVNARVFAPILADQAPGRREEFLARADRAALNRVISGVHYPSDIAAGKMVGEVLYQEFSKSNAFRSDLDSLRKYLRPADGP